MRQKISNLYFLKKSLISAQNGLATSGACNAFYKGENFILREKFSGLDSFAKTLRNFFIGFYGVSIARFKHV